MQNFLFQKNAGGASSEEQAKLAKDLEAAQEEAKKTKAEADRLLQIINKKEEEQNIKDKLIKELQE